MRTTGDMAIAMLCLALMLEQPAAAYTDPGTGAMLLQAVMAGFFGLVFHFRRAIFQVRAFKKTTAKPDNADRAE